MNNISNDNLKKIKKKLEKEKKSIKKQLESFAEANKKLKDDWDTRFPYYDGEIGSAQLEKAADEVEEYEAKLPVEHALEIRLRDINFALNKIKKKRYGFCEKCKKLISLKRLKILPGARFCLKCKRY